MAMFKSSRSRARWVMAAPLRVAIASPRATLLDRSPPALTLTGMLVLSALAHVLVVNALRGLHAPGPVASAPDLVRVTVIEKESAAANPPAVTAPPPRVPVVPRRRLAPAAPPAAAPPPVDAPPMATETPPPPPSRENAAPDLLPAMAPGLALSATTVAGSMKVARGGSPNGRPAGESAAAGAGRVYKAKEFAEAYALTEAPEFLDNVSADQVHSFYPEAARRDKFEGAVIVKLIVDDDGSVAHATATNDPGYGLAAAASRLARLYRFKPGRINGRPVATEIRFTVRFELE
jgi:protein TonB